MVRRSRLEAEYYLHIQMLRKYYASRNLNHLIVENFEQAKAQAWRCAINASFEDIDKNLENTIKHVYILRDCNIQRAASKYLFVNEKLARYEIRKYFELLDWKYHVSIKSIL